MVEIKNLCRIFLEGKPSEVVALRNINLSVKDGEMISFDEIGGDEWKR